MAGNKGFGLACSPRPHPHTCAAVRRHRRAPRWGHREAAGTRLGRGLTAPLIPVILTVGVAVAAPVLREAGGGGCALELVRAAAGRGGCEGRASEGRPGGPAGESPPAPHNEETPRAGRTRAPANESEGRARGTNGHRQPGRSPSSPLAAESGRTGSTSSSSSSIGSPGGSSRGPAMPQARIGGTRWGRRAATNAERAGKARAPKPDFHQ